MEKLSLVLCLLLVSSPLAARSKTPGEKLDKGLEKTKEVFHDVKDKTKKGFNKIKEKVSKNKKKEKDKE